VQNFGGLNILLRFEVDACTAETATIDTDDLTAALSGLGISSQTPAADKRPPIPGISIIHTASRALVPQASLIELKTRASHRPLDWAETYPQLYLSQTAYLYLAMHKKGNFIEVMKVSLASEAMRVQAKEAEAGMGKLRAVLAEVLSVVRSEGGGVGLSLVQEAGELVLYKRKKGTGKIVGKDILDRF